MFRLLDRALWICECSREHEALGVAVSQAFFKTFSLESLAGYLFAPSPTSPAASLSAAAGRCEHYIASQSAVREGAPVLLPSRHRVFAIPQQPLEKDEFFSAPFKYSVAGGVLVPRVQRAIVRVRGPSRQHAYWCFACRSNRCEHMSAVSAFRSQRAEAAAKCSAEAQAKQPGPDVSFGLGSSQPAAQPAAASSTASAAAVRRRKTLGTTVLCDIANSKLAESKLVQFPYWSFANLPQLCRWRPLHTCSCEPRDRVRCKRPVRCSESSCRDLDPSTHLDLASQYEVCVPFRCDSVAIVLIAISMLQMTILDSRCRYQIEVVHRTCNTCKQRIRFHPFDESLFSFNRQWFTFAFFSSFVSGMLHHPRTIASHYRDVVCAYSLTASLPPARKSVAAARTKFLRSQSRPFGCVYLQDMPAISDWSAGCVRVRRGRARVQEVVLG